MTLHYQQFKTLQIDDFPNDTDATVFLPLQVELRLHCSQDPAWGADADGNRGVRKTFIDSWEIESILDLDAGADLTDQLRFNPALTSSINRLLD